MSFTLDSLSIVSSRFILLLGEGVRVVDLLFQFSYFANESVQMDIRY